MNHSDAQDLLDERDALRAQIKKMRDERDGLLSLVELRNKAYFALEKERDALRDALEIATTDLFDARHLTQAARARKVLEEIHR